MFYRCIMCTNKEFCHPFVIFLVEGGLYSTTQSGSMQIQLNCCFTQPLVKKALPIVWKQPKTRGFLCLKRGGQCVKIAIMIDGAFFLKRAHYYWGSLTPHRMSVMLFKYCQSHVRHSSLRGDRCDLYRIFFYDCPPPDIKIHHPVTKKIVKYGESPSAQWRRELHQELRGLRKFALRLGEIDEKNPTWKISGQTVKDICLGKKDKDSLTESDVVLDIRQKGVDMRIGLDIASVTFKKQADQIILISGDSDFVPAAKLARREGMDFILDSMNQKVKPELHEHIDGLFSVVCSDGKIKYPQPEEDKRKPGRSLTHPSLANQSSPIGTLVSKPDNKPSDNTKNNPRH